MSEKPETKCTHLNTIVEVVPSGEGCLECLEMGDTWVHLRLCLTCGHVGCCDNSKNKHATKHFNPLNLGKSGCGATSIRWGSSRNHFGLCSSIALEKPHQRTAN